MRDMGKVVEAMCAALPPDRAELMRMLRGVARKMPFTAPEGARDRWVELSFIFNREVFGSSDQAQWNRDTAPEWAIQAGRILAAEVTV